MSVQEEMIIVDAFSSLIDFQPPVDNKTWFMGGYDNDPDQDLYSNSTFLFCDNPGCTATMIFTGTGAQIVGAYRGNGGPYSVSIDGVTGATNRTGPPPSVSSQEFGYVMFDNRGQLPHGLHTIALINMAPLAQAGLNGLGHIDIDYIIFSTEIAANITDMVVQDTQFTYNPPQSWSTNNTGFPDFNNGTVHFTNFFNATASLDFQGTRIIVYGAVGDAGSAYTAQVDNGQNLLFNGTRPGYGYHPRQILFYMDNLSDSSHSLTLTALPSGSQMFSLDYVIVNAISSSSSSSKSLTGPTLSATTNSRQGPTSSAGLIAGIALGSVAATLIVVLIYFWLLRHRKPLDDSVQGQIDAEIHQSGILSSSSSVLSHGSLLSNTYPIDFDQHEVIDTSRKVMPPPPYDG